MLSFPHLLGVQDSRGRWHLRDPCLPSACQEAAASRLCPSGEPARGPVCEPVAEPPWPPCPTGLAAHSKPWLSCSYDSAIAVPPCRGTGVSPCQHLASPRGTSGACRQGKGSPGGTGSKQCQRGPLGQPAAGSLRLLPAQPGPPSVPTGLQQPWMSPQGPEATCVSVEEGADGHCHGGAPAARQLLPHRRATREAAHAARAGWHWALWQVGSLWPHGSRSGGCSEGVSRGGGTLTGGCPEEGCRTLTPSLVFPCPAQGSAILPCAQCGMPCVS